MRQRFPQFKVIKRGKYDIEFIGNLQPKPTSHLYTVSITYRGSNTPLVRIVSPKLVDNPPHFYKKENALCLYHSKDFKWKKEKLIAGNIVAWTSAWLYFYELWLRDDKWYGPEVDHGDLLSLETN